MEQMGLFDVAGENYKAFTEKFKAKKTTDDCYTPPHVYEAVASWVSEEYGIDRDRFVRPFRSGGDYQAQEYIREDVVVDNPPFSILSQIMRHYCGAGIPFFLFAPALTLFTATELPVCYLPIGVSITYDNGAEVSTSFVTNMDEYKVRVEPELYRRVKSANDITLAELRKSVPKYAYPKEVITAGVIQKWAKYGVRAVFMPEDCTYTGALDAQREVGKSIFGGGFLLRPAAAAAAAPAEEWELSDRERALLGMPERVDQGQMRMW